GEELGLSRPVGRLLVVDYMPTRAQRPEGVVFVFDGGVLTADDIAGLRFPDGEILSAGFYTVDEACALVKPVLSDRLAVALEAGRDGTTVLCDSGVRSG